MQQWEYEIERDCFIEEEAMNIRGREGWELASVVQNRGFDRYCLTYYFKRPIPQIPPQVEGIPKAAFDEHPTCTCDDLCPVHSV